MEEKLHRNMSFTKSQAYGREKLAEGSATEPGRRKERWAGYRDRGRGRGESVRAKDRVCFVIYEPTGERKVTEGRLWETNTKAGSISVQDDLNDLILCGDGTVMGNE